MLGENELRTVADTAHHWIVPSTISPLHPFQIFLTS